MTDSYLCSLAEARAFCRMDAGFTDDDDQLQNIFIPAATAVIEGECGDILPHQWDENYDGGCTSIYLRNAPVLDILNVEEGWGYTSYELTLQQVNSPDATSMFAYSIDNYEMGVVSRRSGGNVNIPFIHGVANIRVTYVSGRQDIPAPLKLAGLSLISWWYRGSQQRMAQAALTGYDQVDMSQPSSGEAGGLIGINLGIPQQIIELIRRYRHAPYIG